MANISHMIKRTITTFRMAYKDSNNAITTSFIDKLWLINRRGRRVRRSLSTFITGISNLDMLSSMIEKTTIKKSS